ncbi:multicopper oxidase domain-containing protein [Neorhizobium galegae]|uniref:multicopper oxidase family protein n=1 Tax=Neorhizobium galegae TaxID=399 RepID=UPI000622A262|nr:multicopper oxidase domain-containing protein [Neorhizobium galegae]MCQ1765904.1 multicopper oxidase domain-containing protein [Neorhizobium galegae]MCQ1844818.1 multicopper oxidase domain-containing protein [Neorhizobium galegae]CDZ39574.1 Multicopper oxidase [Neorhizobium galegae bv. officinalis]
MYRRQFLKTLAAGAAAVSPVLNSTHAFANPAPVDLIIGKRTLDVNGKAATVFGLADRSGRPGLVLDAGSNFNVRLLNESSEDTLIHWHGLTPPWNMDGVPENPAALLTARESRDYTFPVGPGGTHWMHAHTLQEQNLLAAPLIVRTTEDRARDEQEVVILLHDFSFKSPEELLDALKNGSSGHGGMQSGHQSMMQMMTNMKGHQMPMTGMSTMSMPMKRMSSTDLNDIEYDAYLANDRTLDDPEVVRVEKSGRIRLRIINGATATAFTIDTGQISGSLIAVDGNDVVPLSASRFPISMGQRVDIRLQLPAHTGSYPILALREGARERTGIILATSDAAVEKLAAKASEAGPVLDLGMERQFRAAAPLPARSPDHQYTVTLTGDMAAYAWGIDPSAPLRVSQNKRVRLTMRNMSMMAHPMHLHGHHFQVVRANGQDIGGAVRDTVLLTPMAEVAVEFDTVNPGRWPLHCHHLYHMATGMMTYITYGEA